MKILVVDSNVRFLEQLRVAFDTMGVEIDGAYTYVQASELVDRTRFDGALIALKLAGMNGLQLVQYIRESSLNKKTNIYLMGNGQDMTDEARTRAKRFGVIHALDLGVGAQAIAAEAIKVPVAAPPKKKVSTYDAKIINAVIEASTEVFGFFFNATPKAGQPYVRDPKEPCKGYITALIPVMGNDVEGSMALTVTPAFLFALGKRIFQGDGIQYTNEMFSDMTGEVCNQVLGIIRMKFADFGLKMEIGSPEMTAGKTHYVKHTVPCPIFSIELGVGQVSCIMEFCLEQKFEQLSETAKTEHQPLDQRKAVIF
jgi:CheY-specific phosphatase CheX